MFNWIRRSVKTARDFLMGPAQTWGKTAADEFGSGNFRYVSVRYAKAGDVVTCENGHAICSFVRDVDVGEAFDAAAVDGWTQPEPKIGDIVSPCAKCGARWFKGVYFHFEDGWRIGLHD